jgi:hypothetical protein
MYKVIFMTQAQKDAKKIASSGLKPKVLQLIKSRSLKKTHYNIPQIMNF